MTPAIRSFVDYFGELGPRWGLQRDACRIHAFLYLTGRGTAEAEIGSALGLDTAPCAEALSYLQGYRMVEQVGSALWRTGSDPWDMLVSGLEERRRREVGPALATLRECHRSAVDDPANDRAVSLRIGKLLELVQDLAALDNQTRRLPPQLVRSLVGLSGRAARFVDRAFGGRRGGG
jgi:DNA-binding transcriptional regulator GbsR (MarR family)